MELFGKSPFLPLVVKDLMSSDTPQQQRNADTKRKSKWKIRLAKRTSKKAGKEELKEKDNTQ